MIWKLTDKEAGNIDLRMARKMAAGSKRTTAKINKLHLQWRRQTDRRTDGRTDGKKHSTGQRKRIDVQIDRGIDSKTVAHQQKILNRTILIMKDQ